MLDSMHPSHPFPSLQNVILDEGDSYAGLLYTWRSLSRAVPAVSLCSGLNTEERHRKLWLGLGLGQGLRLGQLG